MRVKPYCVPGDVISLNGFQTTDMEFLGEEMNFEDYHKLLRQLIDAATNLVNRYCNVQTFFKHEVVDELHTLNTADMYSNTYGVWRAFSYYNDTAIDTELEHVSTVYPFQQPVIEIKDVWIRKGWKNPSADMWEHLEQWGVPYEDERGTHLGRDYHIIDRYELTYIYLNHRYPAFGKNNMRVSYIAGYEDDAMELENIKLATAMIVNNFLLYKKKIQEVATIRGAGIGDYAPMFNDLTGGLLLTPEVLTILNMYRRLPLYDI